MLDLTWPSEVIGAPTLITVVKGRLNLESEHSIHVTSELAKSSRAMDGERTAVYHPAAALVFILNCTAMGET
jgi:hypothetical protein